MTLVYITCIPVIFAQCQVVALVFWSNLECVIFSVAGVSIKVPQIHSQLVQAVRSYFV